MNAGWKTMAPLLFGLAAGMQSATAAPVVVSTLSSWDGSTNIGDFGSSGFSGWGQFLRAPTGTNRMLDFTFLLSDAIQGRGTNMIPVEMQALLVKYNPFTRFIEGPVLYRSDVISVPVTTGLEFKEYTFDFDVAVNAGDTYMMFLFATNFELTIPDDSRLRLATVGNVLGGAGWNIPASAFSDLDEMLRDQWRFTENEELAFSATFDFREVNTVPEPSSALLLATAGLAGVWASRRRR